MKEKLKDKENELRNKQKEGEKGNGRQDVNE
jgi:hypothetical protein